MQRNHPSLKADAQSQWNGLSEELESEMTVSKFPLRTEITDAEIVKTLPQWKENRKQFR